MNYRAPFARLLLLLCLATASVAAADVPPPDSSPEPDDSERRGCSLAPLDAGAATPAVILAFALLSRNVRARARRSR